MQRPAICEFLQGPMTSQHAVSVVKEALAAGIERHFEILYYRKDGKSVVFLSLFSLRNDRTRETDNAMRWLQLLQGLKFTDTEMINN